MNRLRLLVSDAKMRMEKSALSVEKCVNFDEAEFVFDATWDGFDKLAVFWRGDEVYQIPLAEPNVCMIPWELLATKGTIQIGCIGTKPDGTVVTTKTPVTQTVAGGAYREGTAPTEPTPSLYAQLAGIVSDYIAQVDEVYAAYRNGEFRGEKGERGEKGDRGEPGATGQQGEKGDRGETGEKGDKGDKGEPGIQGVQGERGAKGETGATFTPFVASDGTLSWTNDKGLTNPTSTNIKGPQGDKGVDGADGKDGADGYTPVKGVDYFDGVDGKDGVDGTDGVSVTAEVVGESDVSGAGNVIRFYTANGSVDLTVYNGVAGKDGVDGADGIDGKDGADGYTPVKGVDYFDGAAGKDGADGKDGVDVTVEVGSQSNESGVGNVVYFHTAEGTKHFVVYNGVAGKDGAAGADGKDGADGLDGLSTYYCSDDHAWDAGEAGIVDFADLLLGDHTPQVGEMIVTVSGHLLQIMTDAGGVDYDQYRQEQVLAAQPVNQLTNAKNAAMTAANQRLAADVAAIEQNRPKLQAQYDDLARQNYQGYLQSGKALANSLASQGLYNSGYSDTAKIAQTTNYRAQHSANERARLEALADLDSQLNLARMNGSADLNDLEAQYAQLLNEQANADRAFAYQQQRDRVADQRYADEWAFGQEQWGYQKEQDAQAQENWLAEFNATQEQVAWEQRMYEENARTEAEQRAIADAYAAAEIGDFSQLKALGIDTTNAEKMYDLEMQGMYMAYGGGTETVEKDTETENHYDEPIDLTKYAALEQKNPNFYQAVLDASQTYATNALDRSDTDYVSGLETVVRAVGNRYGVEYAELCRDAINQYTELYRQEIRAEELGITDLSAYLAVAQRIIFGKNVTDGDLDPQELTAKNPAKQQEYAETLSSLWELNGLSDAEYTAAMLEIGVDPNAYWTKQDKKNDKAENKAR